MTLQGEIYDGLNLPGWQQSISRVKTLVANALRSADHTVTVKDTAYFNHSFVPDFVLSWPVDPDATRDVYLRLESSGNFLTGDVHLLGDEAPVLVGLAGLGQSKNGLVGEVVESAVMVTEPEAVESLATPGQAFAQALPPALLKGGKGVVTAGVATNLTKASGELFASASTHDSTTLVEVDAPLAAHLDATQHSRLLTLARVIWEASPDAPAPFPIRSALSALDDTGLRFLLTEAEHGNDAFWRSVGRFVTLDRLLGLSLQHAPNLAALIHANADRISARAIAIRPLRQQRLGGSQPTWSIGSGALILAGSNFDAYFVFTRESLGLLASPVSRGISLVDLRDRTSDEQVATVIVRTVDGKTVSIESDRIFDPSTDDTLASVARHASAAIKSVGIVVEGKHLDCDFSLLTATGHTSASFDLLSLLLRALPLLWPLTDESDIAELNAIRRVTGAASTAQLMLWRETETTGRSSQMTTPHGGSPSRRGRAVRLDPDDG